MWNNAKKWSDSYQSQQRVRSRLEGMPTIGEIQETVTRSGKEPSAEQQEAFEAEVLAAALTIRQRRDTSESNA